MGYRWNQPTASPDHSMSPLSPPSFKLAPEWLWTGAEFKANQLIEVDETGRIQAIRERRETDTDVQFLANQILIPGLSNGHSHAFQRVIRGRTHARYRAGRTSGVGEPRCIGLLNDSLRRIFTCSPCTHLWKC